MMQTTENKLMVSFRMDADLVRRLDKFIATQRIPVKKTAVLELALKEWLDANERPKK
jgi:hypothetical protein